MRRRTLILGVTAALSAAACSRSPDPESRSAPETTPPPGAEPVALWSLDGGATPSGLIALRPPRLVVYPDGVVIADATYRSDLSRADLSDLVAALVEHLAGPNAARRQPDAIPEPEAPATVLTVRSAQGSRTVRVAALEELRAEQGYPAALYTALDRLAAIHQRVVGSGQPYLADRIRLVAEADEAGSLAAPARHRVPASPGPVGPAPGDVQEWPAAVAVPGGQGSADVMVVDLNGDPARAVVRSLARDLDLNGAWPSYQTADGRVLRATWRYLLPSE